MAFSKCQLSSCLPSTFFLTPLLTASLCEKSGLRSGELPIPEEFKQGLGGMQQRGCGHQVARGHSPPLAFCVTLGKSFLG